MINLVEKKRLSKNEFRVKLNVEFNTGKKPTKQQINDFVNGVRHGINMMTTGQELNGEYIINASSTKLISTIKILV